MSRDFIRRKDVKGEGELTFRAGQNVAELLNLISTVAMSISKYRVHPYEYLWITGVVVAIRLRRRKDDGGGCSESEGRGCERFEVELEGPASLRRHVGLVPCTAFCFRKTAKAPEADQKRTAPPNSS